MTSVHDVYKRLLNPDSCTAKLTWQWAMEGPCSVCECGTTSVLEAVCTFREGTDEQPKLQVYVHPECWRAYCGTRMGVGR